MSNLDKIRAIAADNSKSAPNAVAAAIDKQLLALTRDLSRAGVELNSIGRISASALSKKLRETDVPAQKRLEIKIALERAGLLSA